MATIFVPSSYLEYLKEVGADVVVLDEAELLAVEIGTIDRFTFVVSPLMVFDDIQKVYHTPPPNLPHGPQRIRTKGKLRRW